MSREMRHSGIEWIGEIPKEWLLPRLKNVAELHGRIGWNGLRSEEFEENSYAYLVTGQDFKSSVIDWSKCYQIRKERYDEDTFIQLENGELLITKDGTIGKVAVVSNMDKPACLNSGIFVIRQKKDSFVPKFLYWQLCSSLLKTYNDYMNLGGTTIIHLYQNVFERMPLIAPPLSEQQKIANYLDKVCGEVDEMIALQEQMIEELKAYKQSVITEAVTKGLNPNAPMRDSGIDWIGEVPEGWRTTRIKSIITLLTDYDANGSFADIAENVKVNTGSPYAWMVRATDLENNRYGIVEGNNYCDESTYYYLSKSYLNGGEIIIAKRGEIGKVYLVPECECKMTLAPNTYVLRLKDSLIFNKYLYYYMLSEKGKVQLVLNNKSTAIGAIYKEDVKKIAIALPPLSEQQSIASYLDTKCAEIDALIAIKQKKIDELKDYKKSVIYEYVTGKKEVI